ncbi:MAG: AAA family ATPase [Spirochaetales bacterium]|nr:AAA family ATPase [Spirochaetales bacterium]
MHLKKITLNAGQYPTHRHFPFNLEILNKTGSIDFTTPVTFFVGENGTGKSTLLEAITYRCGIYIWRGVERARCTNNPYEQMLYRYVEHEWSDGPVPGSFFASSIFNNFARILDEWASSDPGVLDYFGGESLLTKSHGQSFMAFFRSRYTVKGLYLLDEPETALSPRSQLSLLDILCKMTDHGHAQFIIATHSPILLACKGATIYSFDRIPVKQIAYEETDHFRVYKEFMADPKKMLED